MVEVKIGERGFLRQRHLATVRAQKMKGIRVVPRDDRVRELIKHPKAGAFRSVGSMEWPNDRFTRRRLADGTVKLAEDAKKVEEAAGHHRSNRRHPQSEEVSS